MNFIEYIKPKRLFTRMVVLIFLALLLAQGISVIFLSMSHKDNLLNKSKHFKLIHFISFVKLLEGMPEELHAKTITAWEHMERKFIFTKESPVNGPQTPYEIAIKKVLVDELGESYKDKVRVSFLNTKNATLSDLFSFGKSKRNKSGSDLNKPLNLFYVAVQLNDKQWFSSHMKVRYNSSISISEATLFVSLSSLFVILVVVWQLRHITLPLRNLSDAANALGRGQTVDPIVEQGPDDLKQTLRAFNRMNERIQRFTSERTRIFASISHDLRTPITGMRLRLEMMDESENRDKLIKSLNEMHVMSEATLAFLKQSEDVEQTSLVDVEALVESLCQNLIELNSPVIYQELNRDKRMVINARPLALKRAINNLIENAIKYGKQASVALKEENDAIIISIEDKGSGIPETEMESVLEPFYQINNNYLNSETAGYGLGMSIAQQVIVSHGGKLQLINYTEGLRVLVTLPKG